MKIVKLLVIASLLVTSATTSFAANKCTAEKFASKKAESAVKVAEKNVTKAQKTFDSYDSGNGLFMRLQRREDTLDRQYENRYRQISDQITRVESQRKQLEVTGDYRIASSILGVLFGNRRPANEIDRHARIRAAVARLEKTKAGWNNNLVRLKATYDLKKARFAQDKVKLQENKVAAQVALDAAKVKLDTANAVSDQKDALMTACLAAA